MKLIILTLVACIALSACGKKGSLKTPPAPGEQQEEDSSSRL